MKVQSIATAWNVATPAQRSDWLRAATSFNPKGGSDFYHVRFERLSDRVKAAVEIYLETGATKKMRLTSNDLLDATP